MAKFRLPRCRLWSLTSMFQIVLGSLVIIVSLTSLLIFYRSGFFWRDDELCRKFCGTKEAYSGFDVKALSDRVDDVLEKLAGVQSKLESSVQQMEKGNMSPPEFKKFLEDELLPPVYSAHISLRQIRIPKGSEQSELMEDPLINFFTTEEIRKYITSKETRSGKANVYGIKRVYNTIGHACVLMRKDVEEYMSYDIGNYCREDWNLGQRLMIRGCDPLPRRRCLTRAPKLYLRPSPINESLWQLPDDKNVRWSFYQCKNFSCLAGKDPKGITKCTGCFNLEKEKVRWVQNTSLAVDFLITDVLNTKPGEIRIGLDIGVGTGSFAARMREHNVTIVSTTLNLGAPFSEMIALRGLIPLYVTVNQRLPFFDNTMDLIHTGGFLDGWIDLQLMDFVLFDWDRILRPGGLLWIDRFFCSKEDLDDYMYMFLQFRYKKHRWVVSSKSKVEVYLSALLEKPPRTV
ncbi:unnamed protein product [Victoria cruziana]